MNVMLYGRRGSILATLWRLIFEDPENEDIEYHPDTEQDLSIISRLKDTFTLR